MILAYKRAYPWILLLVSCIMVTFVAVVWSRLWFLVSVEIPADYGYAGFVDLGWAGNYSRPANNPNEDRSIALQLDDGSRLAAVFDGHGGIAVSQRASELFTLQALTLKDAEAAWQQAPKTLEEDFFKYVQRRVEEEQHRKHITRSANDYERHLQVGSCALVAWMKDNVVHIANTGDSSAYFFSDDGTQTRRLNNLHNIALASEQEAMKSREEFKDMNPDDLFTCRSSGKACYVRGRLQLTRALGDLYLDNYIRREPEISFYEFDQSGYVLLGSDGFWDEFPTRDEIEEVKNTLLSEAVKRLTMAKKAQALVHLGYQAAGRRTKQSAEELETTPGGYHKRKLVDDMTVVVIRVELPQEQQPAT